MNTRQKKIFTSHLISYISLCMIALFLNVGCQTLGFQENLSKPKEVESSKEPTTDDAVTVSCHNETHLTCDVSVKETKSNYLVEITPRGQSSKSFSVPKTDNHSSKTPFYVYNDENGQLFNGILFTDSTKKPSRILVSFVNRKDQAEIFDLRLKPNRSIAAGSHFGSCTIKNKVTPCKIMISKNKQDLNVVLTSETSKLGNSFSLNDASQHLLAGDTKEIVSWSKKKNKEDYLKLKISKNNHIIDGMLELRDMNGSKNKVYFTR